MSIRKKSKKRDVVLEVLRGTDTHPSAQWIYSEAKKIVPDLSLGTVYRNLNLFKEEGLVVSVGVVLSAASEGTELPSVGSEPVTVGMVAWGRDSVGRVVSWVAVGWGMTVGRVVSSVIMPPGWVLTLASQAQPVNAAAISTMARVRLKIFFMIVPPVRMLTGLVCRGDSGINKEIFVLYCFLIKTLKNPSLLGAFPVFR